MRDNKPKEVKVASSDCKYILYTDASYESGTGGIGGVLIDSTGSVANWFSHQLTEGICLALGAGDKETIIYEL